MRNTFHHLDFRDRDRIEALWRKGHSKKEIADVLGVHKSTIGREVEKRKGECGTYKAVRAEDKAHIQRSNSKYQGMKIELNPELRRHIVRELKVPRAPGEIAGRMKQEAWETRVSSDAIYRWLRSSFGKRYCKYLCTKRYRKKQHSKAPPRYIIPNMMSIHNIPCDPGGVTEGDTFLSPKKVSKTSAVLVVWRETK